MPEEVVKTEGLKALSYYDIVEDVLKHALVVLWDGDPRRQADCELCQKINALLKETQRCQKK